MEVSSCLFQSTLDLHPSHAERGLEKHMTASKGKRDVDCFSIHFELSDASRQGITSYLVQQQVENMPGDSHLQVVDLQR